MRLVPVKISDVEPDGLLYGRVHIDLHEIRDEATATDKLLRGLGIMKTERKAPGFPGSLIAPVKPVSLAPFRRTIYL